jgi:hypothetical protein
MNTHSFVNVIIPHNCFIGKKKSADYIGSQQIFLLGKNIYGRLYNAVVPVLP